jgi:hypothetical protein
VRDDALFRKRGVIYGELIHLASSKFSGQFAGDYSSSRCSILS